MGGPNRKRDRRSKSQIVGARAGRRSVGNAWSGLHLSMVMRFSPLVRRTAAHHRKRIDKPGPVHGRREMSRLTHGPQAARTPFLIAGPGGAHKPLASQPSKRPGRNERKWSSSKAREKEGLDQGPFGNRIAGSDGLSLGRRGKKGEFGSIAGTVEDAGKRPRIGRCGIGGGCFCFSSRAGRARIRLEGRDLLPWK